MPKKFLIGIDLGGTNLKIALLDSKYRIRLKEILSTKSFIKRESLIRAIVDSVNKIIQDGGLKKSDISGVGLGLPGPIDVRQGLVHFFPNIPGWKEVRLKNILQAKLRLPVYMDNDANLMALAEYRLGAARGSRNAVCLTLGTGVGGGIIIGGQLYRGSSFSAGEIGHIPLNENGPRCNCGAVACLESYIGNKKILREARRVFRRNISLEELSRLAKKADARAIKIWDGVGLRLGIALTGVVNLLAPDVVVIGGGVANAGRRLFDRVEEVISRRAMRVQAQGVKVLKARLASDAGMIGAALLVAESIHGVAKSVKLKAKN
jgi:glucokinase